MDKLDLINWFLAGGFSVLFTLILILWNSMNSGFEKVDKKFDKVYEKFDQIDNDIKELRTSINRMEGAFYNKECCMIKNDQDLKKAE